VIAEPGTVTILLSDLETLLWITDELYNGGSWSRMEAERPEINDVLGRLSSMAEEAAQRLAISPARKPL
jgi:hypothetical protein